MILSTSHNFIFIHVPKTAGTALTEALSPFAVPVKRTLLRSILRRLPLVQAPEHAHFRGHEPASRVRAKLSPAVFDAFHKFAVVRNPFDHAVSHFEFMKQFRIESTAAKVRKMNFEAFLNFRIKKPLLTDTIFTHQPAQSWFVADDQDRLLVDRLMYFETLAQDFERLVADLGLTGAILRKVNPTRTKAETKSFASYADYYSETTIQMVRELYVRDFENFGYSADLDKRLPQRRVAQPVPVPVVNPGG